jgi:hypothetical protein
MTWFKVLPLTGTVTSFLLQAFFYKLSLKWNLAELLVQSALLKMPY